MYKHASLVDFVNQWVPPVPATVSHAVYDFTEYIGKRVRVDRDDLIKLLIEHDYTIDKETGLVSKIIK